MCLNPLDVINTQKIFKKIRDGETLTQEEIVTLEQIGISTTNIKNFTKLCNMKENVSSVLVK